MFKISFIDWECTNATNILIRNYKDIDFTIKVSKPCNAEDYFKNTETKSNKEMLKLVENFIDQHRYSIIDLDLRFNDSSLSENFNWFVVPIGFTNRNRYNFDLKVEDDRYSFDYDYTCSIGEESRYISIYLSNFEVNIRLDYYGDGKHYVILPYGYINKKQVSVIKDVLGFCVKNRLISSEQHKSVKKELKNEILTHNRNFREYNRRGMFCCN